MPEDKADIVRKMGEISWKVRVAVGPAVAAFATPFVWGFFLGWLAERPPCGI